MKFLGKIGIIILLLITAVAFGDNNDVEQGGIISNSTSSNQTIVNTDTLVNDDDDDDDTVYVCGNDAIDSKCKCVDEKLDCNIGYSGYLSGDTFKHAKIKIRNKNFTAKIVDLRYHRMTYLRKNEILPGQESTIEELDLYYNDVAIIEDGAFDKFLSLKKLGLKYNVLKSINDTVLTKQLGSTLMELNLAGNMLQIFSANVFQYLSKLTSLDLSQNWNINIISKINGINVTIFPEALSNLRNLNLENCNIKYLDDNVFINLKSLQHLDISRNLFTTVPKAIKSIPNLQHIYLNLSKIISINDCDFCNLPNLKALSLRESLNLKYIDENAFGALNKGSKIPQLEHFSIMFCGVAVLPEKLLNWKNVSKIDIEYNPLVCNCSMDWLINDYNATKPLYVDKLFDHWGNSNKNRLYCHSPSTMSGTHLRTLGGNFCKNETALDKTDDEKAYYVCGEDDFDGEEDDTTNYKGCSCYGKTLSCAFSDSSTGKKLNHTNIQILKSNFTVEIVNLAFNNITSLKKNNVMHGFEQNVKFILLDSNNISVIENGTFEKFTFLIGLDLSKNNLTNVDALTFPSSLQRLSLSKTNLDHIPSINYSNFTRLDLGFNPKIFSSSTKVIFPKSMSKLEILGLFDCNITIFNDNAFVNLQSLKTLYLGHNAFTSIPTALNALPNLQNLFLERLNITVLKNDSFTTPKNLEKLSLSHSNLQRIDDCAFCNLPNLTYLDLYSSFQLSYIHENAFGAITTEKPLQLQSFSINYCKVSILPEKLLDWKNVSKIDIRNNPLTCNCSMAWLINDFNATTPLFVNNLKTSSWPYYTSKYKLYCTNPPELRNEYLHTLAGDFCLNETTAMEEEKIYQVCDENSDDESDSKCTCENKNLICNFLNTTNIEIVSNKSVEINTINIVYGNISHLNLKNLVPEKQRLIEYLNFDHNNISTIENGTFDNFTSLKTMELCDNNLTSIDENVLTKQLGRTLIDLNLGMNNLSNFTSQTFIHLTKLETLKLHFNPRIGKSMTSIVLSSSLSSLRHLELSYCNISTLSDDVFINLRNLIYLGLGDNPLTTFPNVINSLPNLQLLEISYTNITVLSKKNIIMNRNLKYLFAQQSKIQKIEDCAFCNFPNLEQIDLDHNANLSFIHENAFGYAHSHIQPSLALFLINGCNLTSLPEKLLNWTSVQFRGSRNPFTCDCSMNWFIKLVKAKLPSFHHPHYQCHGPAEFEGRSFYGVPDSFCNETSNATTTTSSSFTSTFPSPVIVTVASATSIHGYRQLIVFILSVFIIIAMATVAAGIYYYRSRRVIHSRKNGQDGEEDLLEEDFDVENV